MPELEIKDISRLAFPKGMKEQYNALAWESQRVYFLLLIIVGALLFLWGALA